MDDKPSFLGTTISWLCAVVWIVVLLALFLPLLIVGYLLRSAGTIICNAAYGIQDFMSWLGGKVSQ